MSAKKVAKVSKAKVVSTKKTPVRKVVKKVSAVKTKTSTKKNTATKKAAVKKTSTRKSVARGKVLVCAKGNTCFWTNDGQVLEDLLTLRDALDIMSEDVFAHHVTKEKNDFADWVENVLLDYECAAALRKSRKPNTARTVVVRYLRYYNV